uniref:Uncharacterized protein n=1 Tax=Paramoeba aestuarina TaxID=180227 RepID=A0A7S4UT30_9EUKA|mmetsp:Transcript_9058/g.13720  ORF Transcript_9058/g.13720 Transcript_9058/m.13720 type:complete len:548 (+) Transcript_9058:246-1889(+)
MEVKSVECSIPCLISDFATRNNECIVNINFADFRTEAFDFIFRLTHLSQWYLIFHIWNTKLQQAKRLSRSISSKKGESVAVEITEPLRTCDSKSLTCLISFGKTSACMVAGPTSKFDITIRRASARLSIDYTGFQECLLKVFRDRAFKSALLSLTDTSMQAEGHASGHTEIKNTLYCHLRVCDHLDRQLAEIIRRMRVVIPDVHATFRERQVSEALTMNSVTTDLLFEDEESGGNYNIFVECHIERAYVCLSTALVSMIQAIKSEFTATSASQRDRSRRVLEQLKVQGVDPSADVLSEVQKCRTIPYLGGDMCVPPSGQVLFLIDDFVLTVGQSTQIQGLNVLSLVMESFMLEFAQVRDIATIQRACFVDIHSWNIFRTTGEQRSLMIGSSGTNSLQMETKQSMGEPTVAYTFTSRFNQPWEGQNPQLADFELIAGIIKSFSGLTSAAPSVDPLRVARNFVAVSPICFVPELRVTSDVVVNIDTLLNWAGVSIDTLPKHFHNILGDFLEKLFYQLYQKLCPDSIITADQEFVKSLIEDSPASPLILE